MWGGDSAPYSSGYYNLPFYPTLIFSIKYATHVEYTIYGKMIHSDESLLAAL